MSRILTSIACLAMSGAVAVSAFAMPDKKRDKSVQELIAQNRFKPTIPAHLFVKRHPRKSAAGVLAHAAGHVARESQRSVNAYQVALKTVLSRLPRSEVQSLAKQVIALHEIAQRNKEDRSPYTNATAGLLRFHPRPPHASGGDPLLLYNVPAQEHERERTLKQAVDLIRGALPEAKK